MRGLVGSILTVTYAFSLAFAAQNTSGSTAPKASNAGSPPDLSGIWVRPQDPRTIRIDPIPPMTAAAAEKYKSLMEAARHRDESRDLVDPTITSCAPQGPTRIVQQADRPFQIVQTAREVILLYEADHWVRHVWTDGRQHPEDPEHNWMGHSIGRWDGDTLTVDTVGLNDLTWLDNNGHPHSEDLHIVERFRRPSHDTLLLSMTFEDPKVYTKPWGEEITFRLRPDVELSEVVACDDRIHHQIKVDPCKSGAWELKDACEARQQSVTKKNERRSGDGKTTLPPK